MQNQNLKKRRKECSEGLFCLFLVLFAIFEVVMVAVILGRSFSVPDKQMGPVIDQDGGEPVTPPNDVQDPDFTPVFSGGVLPPALQVTDSTVSVSTDLHSQYAILVNAASGEIIAQKGESARFEPASMTKVMSLIVACEQLTVSDLDKKLTMTQEIFDYVRTGAYKGAGCVNHEVGDEISIGDLLFGIGMESAADCTMLIVNEVMGGEMMGTVADNEALFVGCMNSKAIELGLADTHFDNAIGYSSENNYTTASDMAVIMQYAMQSDLIQECLGKEQHVFYPCYYDASGAYKNFRFTYYSTLFGRFAQSPNDNNMTRMDSYFFKYGKEFTLKNAELVAGKTGYETENFCLTAYAFGKDGTPYVLVLGKMTAMHQTLKDVQTLLDTYIK